MTASSLPAEFASLPFYDVQPNSILRFDTAVDVLLRFDLPPSDPSLDSTFYLEPFSTGGNYSNGGVLLKSIGHPTQTFTNQASASFFDSDFNDISSYLYFHGFDQDLNGGVYYARYTSSVPSDLLVFDEKTNMADASIWNDFLLNVVSPVESSFDDFVFSYADSTKKLIASDSSRWALVSGDADFNLTGDVRANKLKDNFGNNVLNGGDGDDTLEGGNGDDTLDGGNGNDVLSSSFDNNVLKGGAGSDTITAGSGDDKIDGGDGDDVINAGDGRNDVKGGKGNDTINAGDSHDKIDSGDGDDLVDAGAGRNDVKGGKGNDTINAGDSHDKIDSGDGDDLVDAGAGRNNVKGGKGNDTINAGEGNDTIDGGANDDVINAGAGNNKVLGGAGSDSITAGAGNDSIDGGSDNDTILGGAGDDTILGGAGDDVLIGSGSDILTGGAGNDKFILLVSSDLNDLNIVKDFKSASDKLIFTDSLTPVELDAAHLVKSATSVFEFSDELPAFGYNTKTGALFYDVDGSGAGEQVQIALIANKAGIVASDILI